MTDTPVVLIVFLALGTVAVVQAMLLVRSRQELGRSQLDAEAAETELEGASRYSADLTARLVAVEAELRHLVSTRLPELAASLADSGVQGPVPVPGPLGTATLSLDLDRSIDAVLTHVREEVTKERNRVDSAAQAYMRGATTTIQALLYELQTLLQRMQEKYEDPLVAEDLLAADFLNEQVLRRIQSTAVVCGACPGGTREDSHLADIVVGASSRLSGYERVQVVNLLREPVGVIARAVEPIAVTLTELMGNALHHSHPGLAVNVMLQQGDRGVSVIIDDAGVGMNDEELNRAKRLMSGDEAILITDLGDPPRNGFAAIGRLVRQYGFGTHVDISPYGGVRAVVHIPSDPLLTLLDETEHPTSAMAPTPPPHELPVLPGRLGTDDAPVPSPSAEEPSTAAPSTAAPSTAASSAASGSAGTAEGGELPHRRSRRRADEREKASASDVSSGPARTATERPAARSTTSTPEESAERWSAIQRGSASGRAEPVTDAPGTTGTDDSSDADDRAAQASWGDEPAGTEPPGRPGQLDEPAQGIRPRRPNWPAIPDSTYRASSTGDKSRVSDTSSTSASTTTGTGGNDDAESGDNSDDESGDESGVDSRDNSGDNSGDGGRGSSALELRSSRASGQQYPHPGPQPVTPTKEGDDESAAT